MMKPVETEMHRQIFRETAHYSIYDGVMLHSVGYFIAVAASHRGSGTRSD